MASPLPNTKGSFVDPTTGRRITYDHSPETRAMQDRQDYVNAAKSAIQRKPTGKVTNLGQIRPGYMRVKDENGEEFIQITDSSGKVTFYNNSPLVRKYRQEKRQFMKENFDFGPQGMGFGPNVSLTPREKLDFFEKGRLVPRNPPTGAKYQPGYHTTKEVRPNGVTITQTKKLPPLEQARDLPGAKPYAGATAYAGQTPAPQKPAPQKQVQAFRSDESGNSLEPDGGYHMKKDPNGNYVKPLPKPLSKTL